MGNVFCDRPQAPMKSGDRLLWVWLARLWTGWRSALVIVKPERVIAWHRRVSVATAQLQTDSPSPTL